MEKYIFTFGSGHPFAKFIQPIIARNHQEATEQMIKVFGRNWCGQYHEEEYNSFKTELSMDYEELATIIVD